MKVKEKQSHGILVTFYVLPWPNSRSRETT